MAAATLAKKHGKTANKGYLETRNRPEKRQKANG